jgi:hypothetical protein
MGAWMRVVRLSTVREALDIGFLLRGKREGHLTEVAPVVARMTALGMFVAPALLAHVLMLAEEAPAGTDRT